MVYGLLIGKSVSDYNHFFERIMEEDDFNPHSILTDFESGTIKSIESLFLNVVHQGNNDILSFITQWITSTCILILGCLFHFGQCIWRNIQSHGLQNKDQADKSFHLSVKKLIPFAFVPIVDVIKAFELMAEDFIDDDTDEFIDYFEKTWIGERKKRGELIYKILKKYNEFL